MEVIKKQRKRDTEVKYLKQDELKKFFSVIEKSENKFWLRDLTAFQIIYYCWLRASELQLIKKEHYNKDTGEIFITRLKGSRNNTIRFDDKRKKLLNRYIREYTGNEDYQINDDDTTLFKSKSGKPLELEWIRFLMKQYGVLAKLPKDKQHPHCLKHSIAVHLAESWVDLKDLQYYLWHINVNNTTIYFQYTTKQLDTFYEKLNKSSVLV
jgi:site-specific recombinase XerD